MFSRRFDDRIRPRWRIARIGVGAALLAAGLGAAPVPGDVASRPGTGEHMVVIRHVTTEGGAAGKFEPAEARVNRGDTLKIVTDGMAAHNVSFPASDNPGATSPPEVMPYLTRQGQVSRITIDLAPGTYHFQCDPHAALGERGTLIVS